MNSGAEAVETYKNCQKRSYEVKGIKDGYAKIIVCENNFHGRTTTIVSFLMIKMLIIISDHSLRFIRIPYNDIEAFRKKVLEDEVEHIAFLSRTHTRRSWRICSQMKDS